MTPLQQDCLALVQGYLGDSRVNGDGWLAPSFVFAHIEIESAWNPSVVSTDGAGSIGLMQVLPATARDMGVAGDQAVPANSLLAGMRYLSACRAILTHWFGEEPDYALIAAAYNEGPGNVEKGRPDDAYVAKWRDAQALWTDFDNEKST